MARKHHTRPIIAGANLALALAMRGKASAAGVHADRRTKRNRTRSAQKRRAIADQS